MQMAGSLREWLEKIEENDTRQFRHILLFILFPDDFERIFSGKERKKIVKCFHPTIDVDKLSALNIDRELNSIRTELVEEYKNDEIDFYYSPVIERWKIRTRTTNYFAPHRTYA